LVLAEAVVFHHKASTAVFQCLALFNLPVAAAAVFLYFQHQL
jgi:hypothetical protein